MISKIERYLSEVKSNNSEVAKSNLYKYLNDYVSRNTKKYNLDYSQQSDIINSLYIKLIDIYDETKPLSNFLNSQIVFSCKTIFQKKAARENNQTVYMYKRLKKFKNYYESLDSSLSEQERISIVSKLMHIKLNTASQYFDRAYNSSFVYANDRALESVEYNDDNQNSSTEFSYIKPTFTISDEYWILQKLNKQPYLSKLITNFLFSKIVKNINEMYLNNLIKLKRLEPYRFVDKPLMNSFKNKNSLLKQRDISILFNKVPADSSREINKYKKYIKTNIN